MMKLLRCHVQNYGKLHEFDYNFNSGLNIILQKNGWGKSTFASFVKAMLFGLPATTKRDLDQNERAKYTPWQGGTFGGWLEFSLAGLPYRIERTFGETRSKDKVTVYDLKTNQRIDDPCFVETRLGINADTFMRSTFVEQGVFSTASDESIKARLGNLLQNDNNFELSVIDKKLLEAQVGYRLLKGKGGKIHNIECEQQATQQQIAAASAATREVADLTQKINDLNKRSEIIDLQITALRDAQEKINEQKVQQGMREYYANLQNDYQKASKQLEELRSWFGSTPPTDAELSQLTELQRKNEQLKLKLEAINADRSTQKLNELKEYFKNGEPAESELNHANEMLKQLRSAPDTTRIRGGSEKSTRTSGVIAVALGIILLAVGVALWALKSWLIVGIAGLVVGIGLAGIGAYHILRKPENLFLHTEIPLTKEQLALQQKLTDFVSRYQESSTLLEDSLYNIRYKKQQYYDLKTSYAEIMTEKEATLADLQQNHDALHQFYSKYFDDTENFAQCYAEITGKMQEIDLHQKIANQKQQAIHEFEQKQKIPAEILEQDEKITNSDDEAVIRKQIVEQEAYKKQLFEQQSRIKSQIYTLSHTAENLEYYQNKATDLAEQLTTATERWNIIKLTREFLQIAKDSLTSRYLSPLCDAFNEYSDKLLGQRFDSVSIDTDLKVLIEEQGSKMDTKYFSQGIRDIIELCLRLALIKVLFDGSMPPLILDDPFYNLDDQKMKNAMDLVHELSSEMQIIYLACHSSRA